MIKNPKIKGQITAGLVLGVFVFYSFLFRVPTEFPSGSLVRIEDGLALSEIASLLKNQEVIISEFLFRGFVILTKNETGAKSGDYFFENPENVFEVARRIFQGEYGINPVRVTVQEGMSLKEIAEVFENFEDFDKDEFLSATDGIEGYLFPDTYFFLPTVRVKEIVKTMRDNFSAKAGEVNYDTLIMASLIEKEIADYDGRRIVSGILWKRIEAGMPLQVDAVFQYIKGENIGRVTFNDLKIESPYNTYLNKGLPPTPICNPGLDAIDAALNPKESPYWYYLSDKNGNTHFAKTFAEHKLNRVKYLR